MVAFSMLQIDHFSFFRQQTTGMINTSGDVTCCIQLRLKYIYFYEAISSAR